MVVVTAAGDGWLILGFGYGGRWLILNGGGFAVVVVVVGGEGFLICWVRLWWWWQSWVVMWILYLFIFCLFLGYFNVLYIFFLNLLYKII